MLQMAENPPLVFPEGSSIQGISGRWWVAHTKARFEKAFAWDLQVRGIAYFLPMILQVKMSGGRKRRMMMPLFKSYVFFCGDDSVRHDALTTSRLCQVVEVRDQGTLIDELSHLEQVLAGKATLDPYPFAAVGMRCRVAAGPFQGVEGVVIRRRDITRLVLQVSILGQAVALEIDPSLLETAE